MIDLIRFLTSASVIVKCNSKLPQLKQLQQLKQQLLLAGDKNGFSKISPFCPSRVAGGGEGGGGLTPAMTLNSAAGIGVDDLRRLCILRSL